MFLSKPIITQNEIIHVSGSTHNFTTSQVRRPFPGIGVGLFGDILWLSIDYDQLRNGNSGDLRAPEFRPNDVVSHLDEAEGDTPAKPAEGDKPAAGGDASADAGGDLFADEKPKGGAPPPGEGGKVSKDSEIQQLKADKAFIRVVQRQRFLKKKREAA